MVSIEAFEKVKEKFGEVTSWAVWGDGKIGKKGEEINDKVIDLQNVKSQNDVDKLGLKNDVVLVGLNAAYREESATKGDGNKKFGYFHEETEETSDYRLKAICTENSILHGAYITDLVKVNEIDGEIQINGYKESKSDKVVAKLEADKRFHDLQISTLLQELGEDGLKCENPTIICLGWDVYNKLIDVKEKITCALGGETKIIRIPHYSRKIEEVIDVERKVQPIIEPKAYTEVVNGFLKRYLNYGNK